MGVEHTAALSGSELSPSPSDNIRESWGQTGSRKEGVYSYQYCIGIVGVYSYHTVLGVQLSVLYWYSRGVQLSYCIGCTAISTVLV